MSHVLVQNTHLLGEIVPQGVLGVASVGLPAGLEVLGILGMAGLAAVVNNRRDDAVSIRGDRTRVHQPIPADARCSFGSGR